MTKRFPDDYLRIRVSSGDGGLDGYRLSTKTVFQVYAPREFTPSKIISKMQRDFATAVETLATKQLEMSEWIFVHNDPDDLPCEVALEFAKLQNDNPNVKIRRWEFEAIWNVIRELDESVLEELFGPGPTMQHLERLQFPAIIPVIDYLATAAPPPVPNIELPNVKKLEHNKLSQEKAELLRLGRIRQGLVADYLSKMPDADRPESIAQAFRDKYATLRDSGLSPDRVFDGLWLFTGGEHFASEPDKIAAVTAVLSYFFDQCDIFENVSESE